MNAAEIIVLAVMGFWLVVGVVVTVQIHLSPEMEGQS